MTERFVTESLFFESSADCFGTTVDRAGEEEGFCAEQ